MVFVYAYLWKYFTSFLPALSQFQRRFNLGRQFIKQGAVVAGEAASHTVPIVRQQRVRNAAACCHWAPRRRAFFFLFIPITPSQSIGTTVQGVEPPTFRMCLVTSNNPVSIILQGHAMGACLLVTLDPVRLTGSLSLTVTGSGNHENQGFLSSVQLDNFIISI